VMALGQITVKEQDDNPFFFYLSVHRGDGLGTYNSYNCQRTGQQSSFLLSLCMAKGGLLSIRRAIGTVEGYHAGSENCCTQHRRKKFQWQTGQLDVQHRLSCTGQSLKPTLAHQYPKS